MQCERVVRHVYRRAVRSFPVLTRSRHSDLHWIMSPRSCLSFSAFPIHVSKASSSSVTKNDESKDRILSNVACGEARCSLGRGICKEAGKVREVG